MALSELIQLITGILKFLPEVTKLVRILEKSPAEKKAQITETLVKESEKLKRMGRPEWEEQS
jgi:hypothetical protein